ncbi:methyltransferase domain-containing protein [Arthrobacter sp. zg-Y820]|uniref:methyltransferase domain-containing protein n=1 Tax=unclassified Arthrobacter TaxID=235627 RepID=UPI001E5971ED|nr:MULTISPECIES: methyltransferase domain-containing protein [unclassified Arthrobacter]MCC9196702.1 methyltransferase domain-containing protein [Arthrobacter sp. zg-Y820]MDK1279564.1 methyltransferase domain-containing protein [Arthrobacter sp. zg.Y820]WIB08062.1 methyltransferase domain-containing protein [Arthrobacter sp. zg-Y820]
MPPAPVSLLCPVCRGPLASPGAGDAPVLTCPGGHRYDAARQGYFNLLTGSGTKFQADTAEMVQARVDFLAAGHYRPMADELAGLVAAATPEAPTVLDAGAGTGYYLGVVTERLPAADAVALDISKFALRRAARALPAARCLVWDVWRPLPLADASVDAVLNVFAPRNAAEFRRVLRGNGVLAVVTPQPAHLQEIRTLAGMLEIGDEKESRVTGALEEHFRPERTLHCEYRMQLSAADISNVALMGPSARHLDREALAGNLAQLTGPVPVTAAFSLQLFRAAELPRGAGV